MDVFHELGLKAVNAGACSGQGRWMSTTRRGSAGFGEPRDGTGSGSSEPVLRGGLRRPHSGVATGIIGSGGRFPLRSAGRWCG